MTDRLRYLRRQNAWGYALSNDALIDELPSHDDLASDDPGLIHRWNVVHDEIRRRERDGTLADDDWKIKQ